MLSFAASESKPISATAADNTKLTFESQGKLEFESFKNTPKNLYLLFHSVN